MAGPTRRQPRRSIWQRIRHLFGLRPESLPPPPPLDPPDEEPALVVVRPRAPRPAGAIALDLPEPPADVEAKGHLND